MGTETKDTRYNGWTNYETWAVKLWIDNDQGESQYRNEQAQELWDEAREGRYQWETRDQRFVLDLADMLKEEYEANAQDLLVDGHATASVWADLLGAALGDVNWREIAETYLEEIERDPEE